MRAIHKARLDKTRPVVILTRDHMVSLLNNITVATITSTIRGIPTEVAVGPANGLDHDSVIALDNIHTIARHELGDFVGFLSPKQEDALRDAVLVAFGLDDPGFSVGALLRKDT